MSDRLAPPSGRHRLTAILIGLIVPSGAFGYIGPMAFAVMALLAGMSVPDRRVHARHLMVCATRHPIGLLCILMLVLWLPSLGPSPTPVESIKTWVRVAMVLGGATYLWSILDHNDALTRLSRDAFLYGFAGALTLVVASILVFPDVMISLRGSAELGPWRPCKPFASAAACAAPLLVWLAWEHNGRPRVAALTALALSIVIMVASESRSSIAGLAAAILVGLTILALNRPRLRLPILLIAIVLLATVAVYLIFLRGCTENGLSGALCPRVEALGVMHFPLWLVDYHRQHIWAFVLDRVPETLWFGHGLNAIAHIPGADQLVPGINQAFIPSHPHNWLIEVLAETGLFGLVPLLLLVVGTFVSDSVAIVRTGDIRRVVRLTTMTAFWVAAGFNFSLWAPWWHTSFLFLLVILSARPEIR